MEQYNEEYTKYRVDHKSYTEQLEFVADQITTASKEELKQAIFIKGECGLFTRKKNPNTNKFTFTKCNLDFQIENKPLFQYILCNSKFCQNPQKYNCTPCQIFDYIPKNQEEKQAKTSVIERKQRETSFISALAYDIIIPKHKMQHVKCTTSNMHKDILHFSNSIIVKNGLSVINQIPKVMVHFNNKYEQVLAVTEKWWITYSVVCNF